ncbi:MAG: glycine zipper 2TM domain-containing protein [Burkholderiales bacterium]
MKTQLTTLSAALALLAPTAFAGQVFEDYARVKDVTPEYEKVNLPRKECFSEYVPERRRGQSSFVGPLLGGVTGGIIGAQVGRGNGRVAASAAGAAIGAIVGDRLQARDHGDEYYEREVRRCRMVDHWENRISGYRVVYEYQGHTYNAVMPYHPGAKIAITVAVEPVSVRSDSSYRDDDDRYDNRRREDRDN